MEEFVAIRLKRFDKRRRHNGIKPRRRIMLMLFSTIIAGGAVAFGGPTEFHPPVRLKADGVPVHVEEPGWACPCWADMDGDGKKDLLVGQFNGGKIRVYRNLGDGKLAAGDWLKADGAPAEIPGVW
jgi:FG-GAP-like repeat